MELTYQRKDQKPVIPPWRMDQPEARIQPQGHDYRGHADERDADREDIHRACRQRQQGLDERKVR